MAGSAGATNATKRDRIASGARDPSRPARVTASRVFRKEFAAVAAAEPELVAHHLTQAGLDEPAVEWWGKAGDQALRRSAFKEAAAHLGKAIEVADRLAATAPSTATTAPSQCSLARRPNPRSKKQIKRGR